jgi:hypothetical protein
MSVQLVHDAFNQAKADVRDGAARRHKDRDDIDRKITAYLGAGWSGVAADVAQDDASQARLDRVSSRIIERLG